MLGWLKTAAEELEVLVALMNSRLCGSGLLGVDETPVSVQQPSRTRKGYIWSVVGHDPAAPFIVFHYRSGRGRAGPEEFLEGFGGTLLSDAYKVYREWCQAKGVAWAGCWAHVRRKFVDAWKVGKSTDARLAVEKIGELYDLERQWAELEPDERQAKRQAESGPLVAEFFEWLLERQMAVLPQSLLGKAISYAVGIRQGLETFLGNGLLALDNNAVEWSIRPVAVGRKNWLFFGSDGGGRMAAVFMTLIASARRAGHNVYEYLIDIMRRLPGYSRHRLAELLPDRWTPGAQTSLAG